MVAEPDPPLEENLKSVKINGVPEAFGLYLFSAKEDLLIAEAEKPL
jgi:hypothetical protein